MSENRISITRTGENAFLLENRTEYHFRDRFFLAWFLECDGIVIDKGEIAPVRAAAGGEFAFTFTHELPEEGVSSLLLSVVTAVDSEIAPRDREVYCAQFILKDVPPPFSEACDFPLKAEETESVFAIHSLSFAHAFAKENLMPLQLVANDRSLLSAPANISCDGADFRIFKPTLKYNRSEAKLFGLFAALQGEKPLAAGELYTYIYGNGDVVFDIRPDREGEELTLRIPLRPEFDYIEYFAESRVDCYFGAADVLSLKEGVLSGEKEWHGGLRRLSVSSGIVTLHIRPDRPMPFSAENGVLCFRVVGAARLKLSLESEIL